MREQVRAILVGKLATTQIARTPDNQEVDMVQSLTETGTA